MAGGDVMMAPKSEEEDLLYGSEDLGDEEDIDIVDDGSGLDAEARKFDEIISALGDVLVDPEFEELRDNFCKTNCCHFEDDDENKFIYTELFEQYVELMENAIDQKLKQAVPGFSMQEFSQLLATHKDNLMSEVFELLLSLGDFETFKEVMLSYKREAQDGAFGLNGAAMKIYTEEQEDGEERPDLDFGLTVSGLKK